RTAKVKELKAVLFKKALGGQRVSKEEYELDKSTGEMVLVKQIIANDPANLTAIMILLKHWDKNDDGTCKWSNEPAAIEIKQKELELKREIAEENNW
ncbi:MAG: hypothetical protein IJ883_00070, partial [Eubacterium sp.]|nr:hypothetical protein [Eubacterium sp.]